MPVVRNLRLVAALGLLATIAACSGNNQNLPAGSMCTYNTTPIHLYYLPNEKTIPAMTGGIAPPPTGSVPTDSLKAGSYKYGFATLFYLDNRPVNNAQFDVSMADSVDANGNYESSISCVRNAASRVGHTKWTVNGVSEIDVDQSGNTAYLTIPYTMSVNDYYDPTPITVQFLHPAGAPTPTPGAPMSVYTTDPAKPWTIMMVEIDPNTYDLRSYYHETYGDIYLSIRLNWTPPPPQAAAVKPPPPAPTPTPH